MRHWILLLDKGDTGEAIELLPYQYVPNKYRIVTEGPANTKSFDIRLYPKIHGEEIKSLRDSAKLGGDMAYAMLWDEHALFNKDGLPYQMSCEYDLERIPGNVIGRSGDLLFFLAVVTAALPNNESGYPNFAATGKLAATGFVEPVIGISEKAQAAMEVLKATGGLLFYPQQNHLELDQELLEELYRHKIQPCPVKSVEEAIEKLGVPITVYTGKPYLGLNAYQREHQAVYFGRDREIEQIVTQLTCSLDANGQGKAAVTILAPSGAGKSSLIQAGLLPRLEKHIKAKYQRTIISPAISHTPKDFIHPGQAETTEDDLYQALQTRWLPEDFRNNQLSQPKPPDDKTNTEQRFRQLAITLNEALPKNFIALWVIDQLEELFTLNFTANAVQGFRAFLLELIEQGVCVVAAHRNDFFADYQNNFPNGLGHNCDYKLPPLDKAALHKIITGPAERAKRPPIKFEVRDGNSLASKILSDMDGQTDALPMLEFALALVYEKMTTTSSGELMTYAAYEEIGGLEGAIGSYAEMVFAKLAEQEQDALPKILRALTTTRQSTVIQSSKNKSFTSQPVLLNRFPIGSHERNLIDKFIQYRLFVLDQSAEGEHLVCVVHETLLSYWMRAKDSLQKSLENLVLRDRLDEEASHWKAKAEQQEKEELLLNTPLKLNEGQNLLKSLGAELNPDTLAFIKISLLLNEQKQKAERKKQQRKLIFVSGIALIFLFLSLTALFEKNKAKHNFSLALDVVKQFTTEVSENKLINEPHMLPLRKALLGKAVIFYKELVANNSSDREIWAILKATH